MSIPKYSWISEALCQSDWNVDISQGFDVDGNEKIEGEEVLKDVNHNGVLGDSEDWQDFLKRNPELQRENSRVPFFRWGAKFKPTNPLHDLLSIESPIAPKQRIQEAYNLVEKILNRVRALTVGKELTPLQKLSVLNRAMVEEGVQYVIQADPLFVDNMELKSVDCDTSGDVFVAVAHEMGWPVFLVGLPNHVFVRWDDGKNRVNMDYGNVHPDKYYQAVYGIQEYGTSLSGPYLKNLSRDGMNAMYLTNSGLTKDRLGAYAGAIEDYTRAIEINPKYARAFWLRGMTYEQIGERERAAVDYKEAMKDPMFKPRAERSLKAMQSSEKKPD